MNSQSTLNAELPVADLERIDAICDRFEAGWLAGSRPDLASYLADGPLGVKARLFRELLNVELDYRLKKGEEPGAIVHSAISRAVC